MKIKIAFAMAGCLFAISCGKKHESFSRSSCYDLSSNGCSTGEHCIKSTVSNQDFFTKYCTALQDNALNNNCALDLRHDQFNTICPDNGFVWNPH